MSSRLPLTLFSFALPLISQVPLTQSLLTQPLLAQEARPQAPCGHPGQFPTVEVNTGERSRLEEEKNWVGRQPLKPGVPILVLAGHADSQHHESGTNGRATDNGANPIDPDMTLTDEAFLNLATAQRIVELGKHCDLNIDFYDPVMREIEDANDPRTNWSWGQRHVQQGGYALEIHYDTWGDDGYGSGVIPRVLWGYREQTVIDESLAREFGSFPWNFRDVLGAPRRGITILEVGKLEGDLEDKLRNPVTRDAALNTIAGRVVTAIATALGTPVP